TALGSWVGSSLKVPRIAVLPSASVTTNVSPVKVTRGSQPCSSAGSGTPSFSQATCLQVPWNFFSSSATASERDFAPVFPIIASPGSPADTGDSRPAGSFFSSRSQTSSMVSPLLSLPVWYHLLPSTFHVNVWGLPLSWSRTSPTPYSGVST